MGKKILVSVVVVLAVLGGWIASRPSTFKIERSLKIPAPDHVVFDLINDFRHWPQWSPWDKRDPDQVRTYEGPPAGVGAVFSWKGNDEVGEGRMTIVSALSPGEVSIRLEFFEPWKSKNYVRFHLFPDKVGSKVIWRMEGRNDFIGKAFSLFMDMDAMVGPDFEEGLRSLSELAVAVAAEREAEEERRAAAEAAAMELGDEGVDAPADDGPR